jgi:polysaccharide pyruvyl transferase WcaK-like protein
MFEAKRIFQTGTFDVRNYGDLLFPLIAEFRLKPWNIAVQPISPTGSDTGWSDALSSLPFRNMLTDEDAVDAVMLGGGNIVHAGPANLRDYELAGLFDRAYASLWLGATLVGAMRNIAVVWNAPGVPVAITPELEAAGASLALLAADYVSVRDRASADFLGQEGGLEVGIVPDTAIDLARMWPRAALAPAFKTLIERKAASPDSRFLAIHVKERSLDLSYAEIAAQIEQFAVHRGLVPLLIAIGLVHDDHITARQIARHLQIGHVLLEDPIGLTEIAAAIAHSTLYLGSSLHGYITGAAFDVPGVIVARPPLAKHAGFLAHIERPQDLASDWRAAFEQGAVRFAEPPRRIVPDALFGLLDAHWDRIRAVIAKPAALMTKRTRFLRHYVKYGAETRGASWLFEPLSGDTRRNGRHDL